MGGLLGLFCFKSCLFGLGLGLYDSCIECIGFCLIRVDHGSRGFVCFDERKDGLVEFNVVLFDSRACGLLKTLVVADILLNEVVHKFLELLQVNHVS